MKKYLPYIIATYKNIKMKFALVLFFVLVLPVANLKQLLEGKGRTNISFRSTKASIIFREGSSSDNTDQGSAKENNNSSGVDQPKKIFNLEKPHLYSDKVYIFMQKTSDEGTLALVLHAALSMPSKGSTKAALNKTKKDCITDCGDVYKPVCAGDGSGKGNKSFGSECVLTKYNCESGNQLKVVSQGECPGGGGVRLQ
ncbi:unnamed protein product [Callosobruchus maculatus]|uniref:Kazal-like domain-containing protein n=1 Tax=Callosobruchus maculatus TaxID=64391 RepID=A0A653CU99_CALMS|nr:unnamed protein product [Callosobruchus maculatus]